MNIGECLARVRVHGFLGSVGVLVGGTAFAAAITGLVLPILTRLYTPHDFSVLAVFTGVVSIISVAACLRFDVAIPIPERDSDAANLLGLALLCTLTVSTMLGIGLLSIPTSMIARFNHPSLEPYLWLLPFGVLFAGCYSALQYWLVRKKEFGSIARIRVAQAGASSATQISFGWFAASPFGLILGPVVNTGAGCVGLCYRIAKTQRSLVSTISWSRMRSVFHAYDRFPKYSTLEALSNNAGMQLPIIMIATLATGPEAGFLLLALYVMQAPMGLIGNAIAQVYLSRAPEEFRVERLGVFTARVFGGLMKSGVGPLIFVGIVAPGLFAKIFGEEWHRAGVLMSWMTPWFVMQFFAAPVSMALHVTNQQKAALVLQLFGLILRVAAVYTASVLAGGFISEAYALSSFVFYLVYLLVVLLAVEVRPADVVRELQKGLPIVCLWTVGGWGLAFAVNALQNIAK